MAVTVNPRVVAPTNQTVKASPYERSDQPQDTSAGDAPQTQVLPECTTGVTMRTGLTTTALAVIALVGATAVISRRAEVLAVATPFVAALVVGAMQLRKTTTTVTGFVDSLRYVEGDTAKIGINLRSTGDVDVCEVELTTPPSMTPLHSLRAVTSLSGGAVSSVHFPVKLSTWGVIDLSELELSIRTSDQLGTFSQRLKVRCVGHLKVVLSDEHLRSLIEPSQFRRLVGGHTSSERGDGSELADVREYRPGDPQRWINWRISSRHREPWVTLRHPDRSTTIVIVADLAHDDPVLQRATARATEAIARAHLDIYDKVGVFITGTATAWVEPQLGQRQMLAISDALLDGSSGRYQHVETHGATRAIPAGASILVISPLMGTQIDKIIGGLRSQGRSLLVIEPGSADPKTERHAHDTANLDLDLGWRLHQLQARLRRRPLTQLGIPVIAWDIDQPMEVAVREVLRIRRQRGTQR